MKEIARFTPLMMIGLISVSILSAQGLGERDTVPLKNWDAPMYWQPSVVESKDAAARQLLTGNVSADRASSITAQAQTPANSLVFVGMTPCRIADTRDGSYPAGFGPPSLFGGVARTFAIQSNTRCPLPPIAQAYSFNITVVPQGVVVGQLNPIGALRYLSIWPTGVAQPVVSTLNSYLGTVVANAAIVPAGTNGSVDVFALDNTNLIIDINGYYAQQSGLTLAQGNAGAPSLSFSGDPGTGLFSSAAGTLNMATGGTTRLSLASNGDLSLAGNLNASSGNTAATEFVLENTTSSAPRTYLTKYGSVGVGDYWPGLNTANTSSLWDSNLFVLRSSAGLSFSGSATAEHMRISPAGNVGIGTVSPDTKLDVASDGHGISVSVGGPFTAVTARTVGNGYGIVASSNPQGIAGWFQGKVAVDGNLTVDGVFSNPSDAKLKQEIEPIALGLSELLRLRPVTWKWKAEPQGKRQLGLIAQDVEPVLPELVQHDAEREKPLGLNYIGFIPVTIKAIQEQQAQIEDQQEQIHTQQRQIEELKQLVCLDHPEAAVCN